jgi:predicted DNA-binding protein
MTTTKKRINITLSEDLEEALSISAKRDGVPDATKATDLLRLGLEVYEDLLLENVASERYNTAKKFLSHKEVWGS